MIYVTYITCHVIYHVNLYYKISKILLSYSLAHHHRSSPSLPPFDLSVSLFQNHLNLKIFVFKKITVLHPLLHAQKQSTRPSLRKWNILRVLKCRVKMGNIFSCWPYMVVLSAAQGKILWSKVKKMENIVSQKNMGISGSTLMKLPPAEKK